MLQYEFNGEELPREIYEEAYYIMAYYKRILKKPQQKAQSILFTLKALTIYGFGMILCSALCWFAHFSVALVVALFVSGIILTSLYMKWYFSYKKLVDNAMTNRKKKVYTISEEKIEFQDEEKNLTTKWENIACILINKYTVCFLPNQQNGAAYMLPVKYAEEVKAYMSTIGKENLIVDNR